MLAACCTLSASQRFFNLTYDQVKIDSALPRVTYSLPLGLDYRDSIYKVSILYPDFVEMPQYDIEQYNKISGEPLPELPLINQFVAINSKQPNLVVSFSPIVFRDGRYRILASYMLKVESSAINKTKAKSSVAITRATVPSSRYATSSVLSSGRWAKIRIASSGVFQLTDALIRKAGFSDISKIHVYGYGGNLQNEILNEEDLVAHDDLKEVPLCKINGKILFYGRGSVSWSTDYASRRTRNPYSDYGYYFITQNDIEPQTVDSATFINSFYPSADDYHSLYEVDGYSWYHGGRNLFDKEEITTGNSKKIILDNTAKAKSGKLSVNVSAGSNSSVQIMLNDSILGTLDISLGSYDNGNEASNTYSIKKVSDKDTVIIKALSGGPIRLDYISMAWDTPVAAPNIVNGTFSSPEYVSNIPNQNHHGDKQADMVIIIPTSGKLLEQAERLKNFHESHDSLSVNIVKADELYNEFSSGTPDANAYRKYLKMLYDRASTKAETPKYLLLFGDCVWDNRMLTSDTKTLVKDDYLLCYESENSFNAITCYVDDSFYALLDDGEGGDPQTRDTPDISVGRFPVASADEAKIMVDKTINYVSNKNAGAWQNTLMFMGDDGNQNLHMDDANTAADMMAEKYPSYVIKKVIWDAYKRETSTTGNTYPEVTKIIKQQQATGALIMDYAGHGSEIMISHEAVLGLNDFATFNNQALPLWITASCDIMPFDGTTATIGEAAVLNANGGAVAFFGTTRTVYAKYNKVLNMAYLSHVLGYTDGKANTIGDAQRLAKTEMIISGNDLTTNKLQYSLLGDPAISLNRPSRNIVIDSINGISTTSSTLPIFKGGGIAKISGHVEGATALSGIITATVRDSRELITCRLNDATEADSAFQYYDRTKVLFNGADSIKTGKFAFSFAVPKDINYSDGTGLINLYAVNNDKTITANGHSDHFKVGGSDVADNDSIGPAIYCYLNSPSFENGGNVNTTPYFVAQVKDENGINVTGSGIGHNLELIIDGNATMTYNLNDNFNFDFGTYKSGTTYYNIPELTEGRHKLQFRAWDILNNSSTAQLDFNVVNRLEPNLFGVSLSNNPATTTTTFIVNHDRTGSDMDVEIEVFDMSGRILWRHSETAIPTSSVYTVTWDLCTDGGNRLHTGVYLYRVKIASEGSSKVSKSHKLIVLDNN